LPILRRRRRETRFPDRLVPDQHYGISGAEGGPRASTVVRVGGEIREHIRRPMQDTSSIQLGCAHLGRLRHVCAFFRSDDETYRVLLPFIADGLDAGQKAIHIVGKDRQKAHLERLAEGGIDTQSSRANGQLELRSTVETYLPDGRFDTDRMVAAFEEMASSDDAPVRRIVCEMDWATERPSLIDEVIRFEARVNEVWSRHQDVVICIYDLARVSGGLLIDIMRTHPLVLLGDTLHQNPFFIPPDEFLRKRAEDATGASAGT
jgi:hypothetical protein